MNEANSFEVVDCPVAELSGTALDYAVAIADGGYSLQTDGITWAVTIDGITWAVTIDGKTRVLSQGWGNMAYQPSKECQHGGPIIEREQIALAVNKGAGKWFGMGASGRIGSGPTPLVAAMRYYVAGKLGDSVKIPRGIMEG